MLGRDLPIPGCNSPRHPISLHCWHQCSRSVTFWCRCGSGPLDPGWIKSPDPVSGIRSATLLSRITSLLFIFSSSKCNFNRHSTNIVLIFMIIMCRYSSKYGMLIQGESSCLKNSPTASSSSLVTGPDRILCSTTRYFSSFSIGKFLIFRYDKILFTECANP